MPSHPTTLAVGEEGDPDPDNDLIPFFDLIDLSPWRGLPEITTLAIGEEGDPSFDDWIS